MPFETDAPLVVYTDAVLSDAIAFQCFKSVARRNAQILQNARIVDQTQFAQGGDLDMGREFPASLTRPNAFCLWIGELWIIG